MNVELDDEERFRSLHLDATGIAVEEDVVLGQFEPHSLVLWISDGVSSALDSKGGSLPAYFVEKGQTPALRGYSTQLHETIHYWQAIGSTAGFIYSLSNATAAFSTLDDLIASGYRRKPILRTLPADLRLDDPRLRISRIWNDIEYGRAMIDDPSRTVALLQNNPGSFVSPGNALLAICANTVATLARSFDPLYAGLVNPDSWFEAYERFVSDGQSGFEREGILSIPIGLRHLMEGQARVSEIQFCDLTQRPTLWKQVRTRGWLRNEYGRAFDAYLQLAEINEPESPRDKQVDLFLLLCDIALNPAVAYADPIDPAQRFVHDFHPGLRFMRLCRAIAKDRDLFQMFGEPSLQTYETSSRSFCDRLGWKTPTEVAATVLERWENATEGAELARQHAEGSFGMDDVHRRFAIGEHRSFLETRKQIPHFFCWPAWNLLVFDNDPDDAAANIHQLLSLHHPPFTAQADMGVTTVNIEALLPDKSGDFISNYFVTIALYDLSRQWIAKPHEFLWRFPWIKQPLGLLDIERLKERFQATFKLPLDSIEAGPVLALPNGV